MLVSISTCYNRINVAHFWSVKPRYIRLDVGCSKQMLFRLFVARRVNSLREVLDPYLRPWKGLNKLDSWHSMVWILIPWIWQTVFNNPITNFGRNPAGWKVEVEFFWVFSPPQHFMTFSYMVPFIAALLRTSIQNPVSPSIATPGLRPVWWMPVLQARSWTRGNSPGTQEVSPRWSQDQPRYNG